MAAESYYFILSVLLVIISIVHLANVALIRGKKQTILGEDVKIGRPGYYKFRAFASTKGLIIAISVATVLLLNALYAAYRIMDASNDDPKGMLIGGPIILFLFTAFMLFTMKGKARKE